MVKLLLVLLFSMSSVYAMELQAYKNSATGAVKIADSEVDQLFSKGSKIAACLKDGSRILGVNSAFKGAGFGYRDCSQGDAAKTKHKALGVEVVVVKLDQLSDAKIRQALGKK